MPEPAPEHLGLNWKRSKTGSAAEVFILWELTKLLRSFLLYFLLAGGAKGKRFALPHSTIMIHQPSGGAQGQATEIQIVADHIAQTKRTLNELLAANTGQPIEVVERDTDRDNYMTAEEAKAYGLIDGVVMHK